MKSVHDVDKLYAFSIDNILVQALFMRWEQFVNCVASHRKGKIGLTITTRFK